MKRLKVVRYMQDPCCCAVASCATTSNYYNPEIDYKVAKEIAIKKITAKVVDEGLESAEIGMLLNKLGFYKVTIVTSALNLIDYTWAGFRKKKMIDILEKSAVAKTDKKEKKDTRYYIKWLKNKQYDNELVISYDFGKYIRKHLNKKKPVILSFNWTIFQKYVKENEYGLDDPFNGDGVEHAVVANGYDDKGVWIVDSHHQCYKYRRKKYRRGFYKVSWENLMTCMGYGDVFLPEGY